MSLKHVVLVGLPGVGKTTVGRAVAGRLRRGFLDLDAEVEQSFGKPVRQIFFDHGEAVFRLAEAEVSAAAANAAPSVIAPGGGWILNEAATAHLVGYGRIIYLRVAPAAAIRRMGRGIGRRPLLRAAADPIGVMEAIYEARRPMYERSSEITIETGGLERAAVVARVVELVLAAERDGASEPTNTFRNELANENE